MDRETFYLLWDVEDLRFAASEAASYGVPFRLCLYWTRCRYAPCYSR
jgi:hypothetical protein